MKAVVEEQMTKYIFGIIVIYYFIPFLVEEIPLIQRCRGFCSRRRVGLHGSHLIPGNLIALLIP